MKVWLAIQVEVSTYYDENGEWTNTPRKTGKYLAYPHYISDSSDVKTQLDTIGGLKVAHLCSSKKRAQEIADGWNTDFKHYGLYAY